MSRLIISTPDSKSYVFELEEITTAPEDGVTLEADGHLSYVVDHAENARRILGDDQ